ncbi:hypothetical protein Z950_2276 [Sulfitobacter mediterraneus KCTC 32188]|nr:hypothetical protein Z950_2276 [Sulfitobacter mediterraneus KCTC 32188]
MLRTVVFIGRQPLVYMSKTGQTLSRASKAPSKICSPVHLV